MWYTKLLKLSLMDNDLTLRTVDFTTKLWKWKETLHFCWFCLDCLGMRYVPCSWENMGTADSQEEAKGTIISSQEAKPIREKIGFLIEKTGVKLCILYKQKLINLLLIYCGITVLQSELFQIWWSSAMKMITSCEEESKWFTEWRYHYKLFLKIKASFIINSIK